MKLSPLPGLARASFVVGSLTLVSRVLGLIRDSAIAVCFGSGILTDAFFVAYRIPNMLRRIVADGALATAFVPVLSGSQSRDNTEAITTFRASLGATILLSGAFAAAIFLFAPQLIHLLSPGAPETAGLADRLLRIMSPFLVVISVTALAASALNVFGRFTRAALPSAVLNVFLIAGALSTLYWPGAGIEALAWAVLLGASVALVFILAELRSLGFSLRPSNPFGHERVRELGRLMLPSVCSSAVYQLSTVITTVLASTLTVGAISWLYYAERVFQFPLGVYSSAIATAALPQLSRIARDEPGRLGSELTRILCWVLFITIPAMLGLVLLADPITGLLFDHGKFTGREPTAEVLQMLALGLCPISVQVILARALIARKDVSTPARISLYALILHIILAFMLTGSGEAAAEAPRSAYAEGVAFLQRNLSLFSLQHIGLALSGTIASFIGMAWLFHALPRRGIDVSWGELGVCVAKTSAASLVMGVVILVLCSVLPRADWTPLLTIPAGVAVFFVAAFLSGMQEAADCVEMLRGRLSGSR